MMNRFFLLLFFAFAIPAIIFAVDDAKPTVCLNMIVKNESSSITRCLKSVLPIIDSWVIVDTGSSDGTQKTITEFMKEHNKPGILYERPWVNFAHNRNEALKLAEGQGDYLFFIDADDYLSFDSDFKLPRLDKDYYYLPISHGGSRYSRIFLVNNHLDWQWFGVLHEVLAPPAGRTFAHLDKVVNIFTGESSRSQNPNKFFDDAALLEKALLDDPDNSRYVFYLAQSYLDAGEKEKALHYYEKRAEMSGWDQETFFALYQVAVVKEALEMASEEVVESYMRAFQARHTRLEPLYRLVRHFRIAKDFEKGYQIAQLAKTVAPSNDNLFVQQWMYDYGLDFELSICAYWIGKYEECRDLSLKLLKREDLSQDLRNNISLNLGFANAKVLEQICQPQERSGT